MIGNSFPVYKGYASQYGHGLGNVLGGLIRAALPVVGKIAKTAGTQLLKTGLEFVGNQLKKKQPSMLERRRLKTRRVKRTVLHPKFMHKRKTPPGQPLRRSKRRKANSGRDIFSS